MKPEHVVTYLLIDDQLYFSGGPTLECITAELDLDDVHGISLILQGLVSTRIVHLVIIYLDFHLASTEEYSSVCYK